MWEIQALSREIAAALRSEPTPAADKLNHLLERQIAEASGRGGEPDLDKLLRAISGHYDRVDLERRGVQRDGAAYHREYPSWPAPTKRSRAVTKINSSEALSKATSWVSDAGKITS